MQEGSQDNNGQNAICGMDTRNTHTHTQNVASKIQKIKEIQQIQTKKMR